MTASIEPVTELRITRIVNAPRDGHNGGWGRALIASPRILIS
jgi:hypothetical protein